MDHTQKQKHIVILGAGFAGVYAYLRLHRIFHGSNQVRITLVSQEDDFLFVPLLHEVATGSLLPSSITQPVRSIPRCCLFEFIRGEVEEIDCDQRQVRVYREEGRTLKIKYDFLIAALGSETNFYGVLGARANSLQLKTMEDAKKIKNRMIDVLESAELESGRSGKERILRFAVVGGGPTGVEVAGEMADYLGHELARAFPKSSGRSRVTLFQRGTGLTPGVEKWFSDKAFQILEKMGVEVLFESRVSEVSRDGLVVNGEFLLAKAVIWAAGVRARGVSIVADRVIEFDASKHRIKVNSFLQVPTYQNIFVAGDMAWIYDLETGQPYPMRAQFAVREGESAAKNIAAMINGQKLTEFRWRDMGFILSLGKGVGIARVFGIRFSGFLAWVIYRSAYLFNLVGMKAKLRTALEWGLGMFSSRDVSKF